MSRFGDEGQDHLAHSAGDVVGVAQEPPRSNQSHPGDTQETPRKHPEDSQETPRRDPGETQGTPRDTKDSRDHFKLMMPKP